MKAIGLMAGTSLDGIDAAAVELRRNDNQVDVAVRASCIARPGAIENRPRRVDAALADHVQIPLHGFFN